MSESSDRALLDLIRRHGPLTVAEMSEQLGGDGHGGAQPSDAAGGLGAGRAPGRARGRGRPRHAYQASVEAQKRLGQNYADLAVVLWDEMMRTVEDRKLRRLLFAPDHRTAGRALPGPGHRGGVGRAAGAARHAPPRPGDRGRGDPAATAAVAGPEAAFVPLLRAGGGRSRRSAPWNARCSRRCSAAACGSASAGSTATARATSRPSRSVGPAGCASDGFTPPDAVGPDQRDLVATEPRAGD